MLILRQNPPRLKREPFENTTTRIAIIPNHKNICIYQLSHTFMKPLRLRPPLMILEFAVCVHLLHTIKSAQNFNFKSYIQIKTSKRLDGLRVACQILIPEVRSLNHWAGSIYFSWWKLSVFASFFKPVVPPALALCYKLSSVLICVVLSRIRYGSWRSSPG